MGGDDQPRTGEAAPPALADALLYRELVEEMSEGLCISAPDYTFQFANPALEHIFGVARGGLQGHNLLEFIPPESLAEIADQRTQRAGGQPGVYRLRIRRPSGEERTLAVHARPQLDPAGAYCGSIALVTDITDQLAAEEALQRSRIQYQQLFERLTDVALYETGESRQQYSANLPYILGMTPAEYKAHEARFDLLLHPDDLAACRARTAAWRSAGAPGMLALEFRARHKAGHWIWLKDRMVRLDPDRGDAYYAGIMVDITQRVHTEQALAASRQRLAMLVDQSPAAIIVFNRDLRISEWNRAAERTFGYATAEAIGSDVELIIPPAELEQTRTHLAQLIASGGTTQHVNLNLRSDGEQILCQWSNTALLDASGSVEGILATCQDITAQRAAEEAAQLARLQSAELATIQTTTGTYAHEINNPLTGVLANAQMLLEMELEAPDSERAQMLREIHNAALQIGSVIRRLQSLAKPAYRSYLGRNIIDLDESEEES